MRHLTSNPKNIIALQVLADIADRGNDWRLALTRWQNVNALATDPAHINALLSSASVKSSVPTVLTGDICRLTSWVMQEMTNRLALKASARIVRRTQPSILVGLEVRDFDAKQPFAPGETDGPPANSPLRDPISETKVRGELGYRLQR